MRFREAVLVPAPPTAVWEVVGNPRTWPAFFPDFQRVECERVVPGGALEITAWKAHQEFHSGRVEAVRDDEHIAVSLVEVSRGSSSPSTLSFTLEPVPTGTRLIADSYVRTPVYVTLIAWFVCTFGETVGKCPVEKVRDLFELPEAEREALLEKHLFPDRRDAARSPEPDEEGIEEGEARVRAGEGAT